MSGQTARLRAMLRAPGLIRAPGVTDAVGARLVASEGFDAIYMTGAGTAATRLGWPDVGLLTMTEMADNAYRIAEASGLPLIADGDTGYGGPLNVRRTVREYVRAGVAALHLEDQQWPKRCGHLAGKTLIPGDEMAAKIRAARDAAEDPDFVVIARTDAIAVEGFEAAMTRAAQYEEAGADAIFVEAPTTLEQLEAIPTRLNTPAIYNLSMSGKTPFLPAEELERLGFRIAIYPNMVLMSAIPAITRALRELKTSGDVRNLIGDMTSFSEFFDLLGMDEVKALETRYQVSEEARVGY